jgi:predicted house-cleaning noncanonical NTP pyrophosphatase (MazG superfamily)
LTPAPNGYPIKLVRDRTADIINETGCHGALFYDTIPGEDRPKWLRRKLMEEVAEYLEDHGADELADILAVIEGLAGFHGLTLQELTQRMHRDHRGGFLTGQMMYGHHPEFDDRGAMVDPVTVRPSCDG